jgi:hypothetical protein
MHSTNLRNCGCEMDERIEQTRLAVHVRTIEEMAARLSVSDGMAEKRRAISRLARCDVDQVGMDNCLKQGDAWVERLPIWCKAVRIVAFCLVRLIHAQLSHVQFNTTKSTPYAGIHLKFVQPALKPKC